MKVLGWPGARFGAALAQELGCGGAPLDLHTFPDGETRVRLPLDVAGEDVVLAVSLDRPDAKTLALLFAADAARELGAASVLLAAPYLPYMRQDTRFTPGEAVSSRTFARLLSSSLDGLVTVDPHLHRWPRLNAIYAVRTRVVHAAPAIAAWIARHVDSPLVVGPDAESEQWAAEVARLANAPWTVMDKKRRGDRDVSVQLRRPAGEVGRTPVLIDDIVSSGATLAAAARALRQAGFRPPVAIGVHALFAGAAMATLREAGIQRIVTCDTIEHPSNDITLVPAIAQALRERLTPWPDAS